MGSPQVAHVGVALQGGVHECGTPAAAGGGLDHGQRQDSHPETTAFDDVARVQVTAAGADAGAVQVIAHPGNGDFDLVRRVFRHPVPPRGGQSAGRGGIAQCPHCRSYPCGVGERPIVGEVDAARTSAPLPGADFPGHRVLAQPRLPGVGQGDDAVVVTEKVVEHTQLDAVTPSIGSTPRDLCTRTRAYRVRACTNHSRRRSRIPAERNSRAARPRIARGS